MEPILIESLASPLSLEKRRMEARVLNIAKEETEAMVTVLLRHLEAKNLKARESIDGLLKQIAQSREGKAAILENLSHPDQEVRKSVRLIMVGIWGDSAGVFATNYEQAIFFMNLAKSRDIFTEDIVTLAELSKVTLLEGDTEKAVGDIALIVDLLKHRYRSVETMKNYLADMLRITPELSRLGMMSGRIEESLHTAMRANKHRTFDYTKDLIDVRMEEVELVDQIRTLGVTIKDLLEESPHIPLEQMNVMDVWVFTRLKELVRECSSLNVTDRKDEVIGVVNAFLGNEFFPYLRDKAQDRLTAKDLSLFFVIYTVGLACLKLVAEPLPKVAEEIYITYFQGLEGSSSITSVSWPSTVL
ncbi:MAG: hypothetical protein MIO90_03155 [Methanomassiliicoccales archaeon]|nr:hypothetical protein [Methanomassiliicoccales archaeon]